MVTTISDSIRRYVFLNVFLLGVLFASQQEVPTSDAQSINREAEATLKVYSSDPEFLQKYFSQKFLKSSFGRDGHKPTTEGRPNVPSIKHPVMSGSTRILSDSVAPEWTNIYNPKYIPSNEGIFSMKVDAVGNTYIVGISDSANLGKCFLTCKIDSANSIAWSAFYHSPVNAIEAATDLYLDSEKNVYVVGFSSKEKHQSDIIVIKYDNNGNQLWVKSYGENNGSYDFPNVITGDRLGNIYVAGTRRVIGFQNNGSGALLLKLDENGNLRRDILFPGHRQWCAVASFIHVDIQGNVYLAGTTYDPLAVDDFLVMKYDSNGVQQWMQYYNGPGSNMDIVRGMQVDARGNIIITGESYQGSSYPAYDCATIKYDSDGDLLWTRLYSPPSSLGTYPFNMAIDDSRNIYITGYFARSLDLTVDCYVVKYDKSGTLLWQSTYPDTGFRQNIGRSIKLSDSTIYVLMTHAEYYPVSSTYLLKYSKAGALLSSNLVDESELLMLETDPTDKIHIAGNKNDKSTSWDIKVIKLSLQGDKIADVQLNGTWFGYNRAVGITKDSFENIYVVANTMTFQRDQISVIKYNTKGQLLWSRQYGGEAVKSVTNEQGNTYVLGKLRSDTSSHTDILILKYNPDGVLEWDQKYSSTTQNSNNIPQTLCLDNNGNVYIAGYIMNNIEHYTLVVIKYDHQGNEKWISYYAGEDNTGNVPNVLLTDSSGNVYVGGTKYIIFGGRGDYLTIKFKSDGALQWATTYHGTGMGYNYINGLAIDEQLNVFVTGYSSDSTGSVFATLKYHNNGTNHWIAKTDAANRRFSEAPVGLQLSRDGDLFVAGSVSDDEFGDQYIVIRYDTAGNELWISDFDSLREGNDYATAFTLDGNNNVYMTGYRYRHGGGSDAMTIKYNQDGKRMWMAQYQSSNKNYDMPVGVVTVNNGNVFITGSSLDFIFHTSEVFIIKYSKISTEVKPISLVPSLFELHQNYPNPFNPITTIHFALPKESHVTVKVYNMLGQEIATLINEKREAGRYDVEFNASTISSGVYLYRLQADTFTETKKLVLIR